MIAELATQLLAVIGIAVRVYAGLMLLISGIAKLRAGSAFQTVLAAYRILPDWLVMPAARSLPVIEVVLGIALLLPAATAVAVPAAALLLLFAGAVALNLLRGRTQLDCGCGTGTSISWSLVAGNVALAGLLLTTLRPPPAPALLPLAAGAVLGLGLGLVQRTIAAMAVLSSRSFRRA